MNFDDMGGGPGSIGKGTGGLRAETYLRTYPSILALARAPEKDVTQLQQLMCATYGWMPRILRIDAGFLPAAVAAFSKAREANMENWQEASVDSMAKCVRSVVGASKLLHFVNPSVFPIWDSKVERYRLNCTVLPYSHMGNVEHYQNYVRDVHAMLLDPRAGDFCGQVNNALASRLSTLGIEPYTVTNVRAIEMAAFALAG